MNWLLSAAITILLAGCDGGRCLPVDLFSRPIGAAEFAAASAPAANCDEKDAP